MRNIGSGCIVIVWVIEVAIKTCALGVLSSVIGQLKEYVYNVRYSIKPNGCTARTVEGHLEVFIAPTTVGGQTMDQSANDYRDIVSVPVPDGFYRSQPQEYLLAKGNARLEFKVTDEEPISDNHFPPGVADMSMSHTVSADLFGKNASAMQTAQFSGYVQMARPYPVSLAWEKALLIMQARLVHALNSSARPILIYVSLTEEVFGRKIAFTVRYLLTNNSLNSLITGSGLFTDVTSTSYHSYAQSMQLAWANRGVARLQHDPSSDRLIDQCSTSPQITIMDHVATYFLSGSSGSLLLTCPPESQSYLMYESVMDFEGQVNTVSIETMPTSPSSQGDDDTEVASGYRVRTGNQEYRRSVQTTGSGQPYVQITFRGRACRVGYAHEVPAAANTLGTSAKFIGRSSSQSATVVAMYGPCPVYAANWKLVYVVRANTWAEVKATLNKALPNLIFDTNSSGSISAKVSSF